MTLAPRRIDAEDLSQQSRLELAAEVSAGLSAEPKALACRFFYDAEGSALFDRICQLPEYYLWRAEREILQRHASEIAARCPRGSLAFELGSGSATKTRLVLEALLALGPTTYVPVDISAAALEDSRRALASLGARLRFEPIEGEYALGLSWLERTPGPKLVLWLGSNIGNLARRDAASFLRRVARAMTSEDRLLLGVDLRKDARVLEPAYDDAAGVTARFNKNLLVRINRELGGTFALDAFAHRARYDVEGGKIDMSLVSRRAQRVSIAHLGKEFSFAEGEEIHTESCFKYSEAELHALAESAGLVIEHTWHDAEHRFADLLLRRG